MSSKSCFTFSFRLKPGLIFSSKDGPYRVKKVSESERIKVKWVTKLFFLARDGHIFMLCILSKVVTTGLCCVSIFWGHESRCSIWLWERIHSFRVRILVRNTRWKNKEIDISNTQQILIPFVKVLPIIMFNKMYKHKRLEWLTIISKYATTSTWSH